MTISNPEVLDNLPEATSDEVREVSVEEVERALREMNDGNFFARMRAATQHSEFFKGNDWVGSEESTGYGLDLFRDYIKDEFIDAGRDGEGTYERVYGYLEPGSFTRKVALAYYGVDEDTPWETAVKNISDRQTYTNKDFPVDGDINV